MKKFLLIIFIPFFLQAQNFNDALRLSDINPTLSAKSLALSNSNISLVSDYSSSFINPAGLALNRKSILTGGYNFSSFNNDVNFFNRKSDYSTTSNSLNNIGYIYSFPTRRGSLVIGLGYQQIKDFNSSLKFSGYNPSSSMINNLSNQNDDLPYDLGLSFGVFNNSGKYLYDSTIINGGLNQSGSILEKGNLSSLNFVGAMEIGRNLFLGANMNVYFGTYTKERDYFEDDINNIYSGETSPGISSVDFKTFYFNDILEWDFSGYDFRVGLLYKVNNNLSIATMIKSPSVFTIKEKYTVSGESYFDNNVGYQVNYPTSKIEYDITTPLEMSFGGSYRLFGLSFSGMINYVDYTQMEFSDGLSITLRSRNNKEIKDLFRAVSNYALGLEYKLPFTDLFARIGYAYRPSPFNGDPKSFDRKYISYGLGFLAADVLKIDVGYQHGWWENYGDNYGANQSRTFQKINSNSFLLTLSYFID